jgi:proline iminopeptidase
MAYKTLGEGPPLLIINGGPGMNSEGFQSLAVLLQNEFKVILFDQRGTGRSVLHRVDTTTITMKAMVEDVELLRKHLGIKNWLILGHSFGGMLAAAYAGTYPENVRGMVLSSSGGVDLDLLNGFDITATMTESERKNFQYWNQRWNAGDTTAEVRFQRATALAPAYLVNKSLVPKVAERLTQINQNINTLVWQHLNRIHFDCKPSLRSFRKPVLVVQGSGDIIPRRIPEKMLQVFGNAQLHILEQCAHYCWLENEAAYTQPVLQFLRNCML